MTTLASRHDALDYPTTNLRLVGQHDTVIMPAVANLRRDNEFWGMRLQPRERDDVLDGAMISEEQFRQHNRQFRPSPLFQEQLANLGFLDDMQIHRAHSSVVRTEDGSATMLRVDLRVHGDRTNRTTLYFAVNPFVNGAPEHMELADLDPTMLCVDDHTDYRGQGAYAFTLGQYGE